MDFAAALKKQIEADPHDTAKGQRILDIINSPPSRRRDRRLARMEAHARAAADLGNGKIDWSKIDWQKLLSTILDVLVKLLPLILAA